MHTSVDLLIFTVHYISAQHCMVSAVGKG